MALTRLRGSRVEEAQQAAKNIGRIITTVGKSEQVRQNRQQLDRVATAIAGGANTIEAIRSVADQPAEFDEGIGGILQRIGSTLRPQAGRGGLNTALDEAMVSGQLGKIFGNGSTLSPEEKAKAERIKAGLSPRATAPGKRTGVSDFNRDVKLIQNPKATEAQKSAAKNRLKTNPNLQTAEGGDFSSFLKGKKKQKVAGAKFDKAFAEEAFNEALQEAKDAGLSEGFSEESIEQDFTRWWDEEAAKEGEGQKGFGKLVLPRTEFKASSIAGTSPVKAGTKLDTNAASAILKEAGGDKAKARAIAKERGFSF